jgi:hypothetical protein
MTTLQITQMNRLPFFIKATEIRQRITSLDLKLSATSSFASFWRALRYRKGWDDEQNGNSAAQRSHRWLNLTTETQRTPIGSITKM